MEADKAAAKMEKDKTGYYNRTEVAPAYPGGQNSMEQYISNNIEYPQDAIDNNVEGIVYVKFGVDENGNISNVSTIGNKIGSWSGRRSDQGCIKNAKMDAGSGKRKKCKNMANPADQL